ncbi:MAG: Asp-tRNA(Asn)/Glu-tRNA(Gln) amidotransferase subunit GatA [Holosporales bacterium]|jgi:aspartyl-tRNA(Asn)/glutamyl-tRNA(Gln) amidotransferase subunit A|nr:Asp-tRNA(Asn)/Glu-tRNA(Gln) amidotransferase subunit GatA [Holosporales bacterium]
MTAALAYQTLAEAQKNLHQRVFSARALVQAFQERITAYQSLNAFITECPEHALQAADVADARFAKGEARALEGIPLAIKDIFCTKGVRTTAGSNMLKGFVPPYESTVTQKLLDAGAIFLGKTNMDEFAMGSSNSTSAFGCAVSPWKRTSDGKSLVPGGSSGGSAAATAAHLCAGAMGTDTGGSIRQPAAFCGITGIKPTYGRCSRFGVIALASSLDQAGPMTKTVQDAAILLEIISGYDPQDSTSACVEVPHFEAEIGASIKGLRVGIPKEYQVEGMSMELRQLWDTGAQWLKDAGAEIVSVSLPSTPYALPAYYIINPAEASSNFARYDGVRFSHRTSKAEDLWDLYERSRAEGFGKEVKRRIFIGTYVLSAGYFEAYYVKARKVQALIRQEFLEAFKNVDVLLAPTTPTGAFAQDEEPKDPVTMYLNDVLTVTVNLAGLPAISVPAGLTQEKTPLGLQLIAPHFREDFLFRTGSVLESCARFPFWKEG